MNYVLAAGTVTVLIAAAVNDVRKEKIPNILLIACLIIFTASEMISLLVFKTPIYTAKEVATKIAVSAMIVFFMYPFFIMGKLGAGDIKLIAVTAVSVTDPLIYLLSIFIIGGSISIIQIIVKKTKKTTNVKMKVHLGLPILVAYCLAVYLGLPKTV